MVDHNEKLLQELQKKSGNNVCADCGSEGTWDTVFITYFSANVFLVKRGICMGWIGGGRKCVHALKFSDLNVKCIQWKQIIVE